MTPLRVLLVVVATLLSGVVLSGCPGKDYPDCESDDHCKKNKEDKAINEYCLFGKCQECAKDAQCGADQKCNKGRCEKTCSADAQCGEGNICNAGSCTKAQCKSDAACGTGAKCEAGRCKRDGTAGTGGTGGTGGNGTNDADLKCELKGRVPFDFNVSDLRPDSRALLDNFAKCMKKNTGWKLKIEGHADERGTPEFNLSLGESRAKSVRKYLINLGVDENRVGFVSYGEEKPIDAGSSESAWSANRRAELVVTP
ncbi:MAG: OmpA family protein [Deltaproteobacteria bacterium]|nr:OmpA family protein [Deltaproteobacteria bacterium]